MAEHLKKKGHRREEFKIYYIIIKVGIVYDQINQNLYFWLFLDIIFIFLVYYFYFSLLLWEYYFISCYCFGILFLFLIIVLDIILFPIILKLCLGYK